MNEALALLTQLVRQGAELKDALHSTSLAFELTQPQEEEMENLYKNSALWSDPFYWTSV